ncbi:MAG: hypothetical protein ACI828_002169 [Flavobacteriales bacterium]|jgi:uncharacterized protein (DUF1697 family)
MAELRATFATLSGNQGAKFENIITLLNSGNVIFQTATTDTEQLETILSEVLEKTFGFPIPTRVRSTNMLMELLANEPFKDINVTKDTRCYISFLRTNTPTAVETPWTTDDHSFSILQVHQKTIVSVLDLSITNTPKAMSALEKMYGKDITTRNWKTIKRIEAKL